MKLKEKLRDIENREKENEKKRTHMKWDCKNSMENNLKIRLFFIKI